MIPEQRLSSATFKGEFLSPDNIIPSLLMDYELGGVDLNDASEGVDKYVWKGWARNNKIFLAREGGPNILFLEVASIVTELSFAFDQNMNPLLAFVEAGIAKYRWFDTVTAQYTTTILPEGSVSPVACLDDKRSAQTDMGSSDIILMFVHENNLYFRAQRDRYTMDYLLYEGINGTLINIGMNEFNRLQLRLRSTLF